MRSFGVLPVVRHQFLNFDSEEELPVDHGEVDGERQRTDGDPQERALPRTVDIHVAMKGIGAETVIMGAGAARHPWRISGGKTSSAEGFLSPAECETVEGVGVGYDGRVGPGVSIELSMSNPKDDTRQTDAGEPGCDRDTMLVGAEPGTPASSKVPSLLAISSPSFTYAVIA